MNVIILSQEQHLVRNAFSEPFLISSKLVPNSLEMLPAGYVEATGSQPKYNN